MEECECQVRCEISGWRLKSEVCSLKSEIRFKVQNPRFNLRQVSFYGLQSIESAGDFASLFVCE